MKTYKLATIAITLSGALVLGGCPKDSDSLSAEDYDDIAVAMGSLVANPSGGDIGSIEDSLDVTSGTAPQAKAVEGASAEVSFVRNGLTYEYLADCFDADATTPSACSEATTDTAAVAVAWTGNLDLPRYKATITRSGEWTFSDLQSGTTVLNGQGNFDIESSFEAIYRPVTKELALSYQADYDDVTIDQATRQVTSGLVTYEISGSRSVTRGDNTRDGAFSLVAEVEFDGAGNASLLLDGSRSYVINLANGTVIERSGSISVGD